MESLLLVIAGLLWVPRLVAQLLLVALLLALALLFGHFTLGRRLRSWRLRGWRRLVWATIGGLGFLLAGLVFIDLLLFAPALHIALDQIELRSGLDLNFRGARGSLLAGRLELDHVTLRRTSPGLDLDLTVRQLVLDVDMLQLHRPALPVALVRAVGVRGSIVRREAGASPPLAPFVIDQLQLEDLQVDLEDPITAPFRSLSIGLETLEIHPLRSDFAMLDLLCRSEGRGRARGHAFAAAPSTWHARGVPIGPSAHKLGAVGRWLRGGDLDLTLRCGDDHDPDIVPIAIDLHLRDFKIAPPGDSGRHLPASRVAHALVDLGPDIRLHLDLDLPRARFHGARNVAQLGLWDGAIAAWNRALAPRLSLPRDELRLLGLDPPTRDLPPAPRN